MVFAACSLAGGLAVSADMLVVAVTTAATAGIAPEQAGLAAGMLSASQQLGTALGQVPAPALAD